MQANCARLNVYPQFVLFLTWFLALLLTRMGCSIMQATNMTNIRLVFITGKETILQNSLIPSPPVLEMLILPDPVAPTPTAPVLDPPVLLDPTVLHMAFPLLPPLPSQPKGSQHAFATIISLTSVAPVPNCI